MNQCDAEAAIVRAWAKVPPNQLAEVHRREACVYAWRSLMLLGERSGLSKPKAMQLALPALAAFGCKVSSKTLYNWDRALRNDGPVGLADFRGLGRKRFKLYGEFFIEFEKVIASVLQPLNVCHQITLMTAKTNLWVVPPLRDAMNYARKYILPGITAERRGVIEGDKGASIGI